MNFPTFKRSKFRRLAQIEVSTDQKPKVQMSKEEAAIKAKELQQKMRKIHEEKQKEMDREHEKLRIQNAKEMAKAREAEKERRAKFFIEQKKRKKKKMQNIEDKFWKNMKEIGPKNSGKNMYHRNKNKKFILKKKIYNF